MDERAEYANSDLLLCHDLQDDEILNVNNLLGGGKYFTTYGASAMITGSSWTAVQHHNHITGLKFHWEIVYVKNIFHVAFNNALFLCLVKLMYKFRKYMWNKNSYKCVWNTEYDTKAKAKFYLSMCWTTN